MEVSLKKEDKLLPKTEWPSTTFHQCGPMAVNGLSTSATLAPE